MKKMRTTTLPTPWIVGVVVVLLFHALVVLVDAGSSGLSSSTGSTGTFRDNNNGSSSITGSLQNVESNNSNNHNHHHHQKSRALSSVYAIYNLNAFAVTFTTVATKELQDAYAAAAAAGSDSRKTKMTLVSSTGDTDSSLSYPLRQVTQEFLLQGFQASIDELRTTTAAAASGATVSGSTTPVEVETTGDKGAQLSSFAFYDMYNQLVTVDLQVRLYILHNNNADGPFFANNRQRQLLVDDEQRNLRRQIRTNAKLQEVGTVTVDSTTTSATQTVQLMAEVFPTLAFVEPTDPTTSNNNKPGNREVQALFGDVWIDELFTQHRDVYLRDLVQSQQVMLQELTRLDVQLNIYNGSGSSSSSKSNSGRLFSSGLEMALLITLIVIVSVVVFAAAGLVLVRRRQRWSAKKRAYEAWNLDPASSCEEYHDEYHDDPGNEVGGGGRPQSIVRPASLQRHHSTGSAAGHSAISSLSGTTLTDFLFGTKYNNANNNNTASPNGAALPGRPASIGATGRAQSLDSMRHGSDVFSRRQTPGSAHAHDVLEASDRYLSRHRPDLYSYDEHHRQTNGTVSVFGRNYEIPSNPFEFIYNGFQTQQQPQQQQASPFGISPGGAFFSPSGGTEGASRGSFTSPSSSSRHSFTPISQNMSHHQNISAAATKAADYDRQMQGGSGSAAAAAAANAYGWTPPQGAHTGDSLSHSQHFSHQANSSMGSSIWRNLSISSWLGADAAERYTPASVEEQIDYTHRDPTLVNSELELEDLPPGSSVRLEEEEEDYDFAFQDFPRHDGTPCLIYNEDTLLKEREARQRKIFVIGSTDNSVDGDDAFEEKKSMGEDELLTKPVSDQTFMKMLSQNSLAIDGENLSSSYEDAGDIQMDSKACGSEVMGKSPQFQEHLSSLIETKQRRYNMEHKKEDIMNQRRKNRKHEREQERRNRHKEMAQEIEDIEAEFFSPIESNRRTTNLTMSPMRKETYGSNTNAAYSPVRPQARHGIAAASPRRAASPFRNNSQSVRHRRSGSNVSIGATSPVPSRHRRTGSNASLRAASPAPSGRHRRTGSNASVASSPIVRTGSVVSTASSNSGRGSTTSSGVFRPRTSYAGGSRLSALSSMAGPNTHREDSPPNLNLEDFDVSQEYKLKVRPLDLYGSDKFGHTDESVLTDLSMPTMGGGGEKDEGAKYPSPQAVVDEIMGAQHALGSGHASQYPPHRISSTAMKQHRRTRTPTKAPPPSLSASHHRRVNSFDVHDSFHNASSSFGRGGFGGGGGNHQHPYTSRLRNPQRTNSSSMGVAAMASGVLSSPTKGRQQHRQFHSSASGNGGADVGHHRRSFSTSSTSGRSSSQHRRSNSTSLQSEDVFLHGVVAQTRFL